jgi:hypothetical protein
VALSNLWRNPGRVWPVLGLQNPNGVMRQLSTHASLGDWQGLLLRH